LYRIGSPARRRSASLRISRGPVGISSFRCSRNDFAVAASLDKHDFLALRFRRSVSASPSHSAAAAIPPLVPAAAAKAVQPLALNVLKPVAQTGNESPSVPPFNPFRLRGVLVRRRVQRALDDSVPSWSPPRRAVLLRRGAASWPAAALPRSSLGRRRRAVRRRRGRPGRRVRLTRVSRWSSPSSRPASLEKNTVVLAASFPTSWWTAGAGVGLAALACPARPCSPPSARRTAMALAITLAVRDVAGNLFHGVHFLLSRRSPSATRSRSQTTGVVHDLTLRYSLSGRGAASSLYYNSIAAAAVKLYASTRPRRSACGWQPAFRAVCCAPCATPPRRALEADLCSALAIARCPSPVLPVVSKEPRCRGWPSSSLLKAGVVAS